MSVIAAVEMFFIFLMVVHNNPFSTFLAQGPGEGKGLTPLLQNFYMAIHPPSLYIGFVTMTIPFAFGIAALITGHLDDSWLRAVRRWTMMGWLFLSFGLTLGMLWAYEELGWGGFWMWDPVENAAALPWFTATAFLHSLMVQERRGMLRVWNVTLVITTFFLTIFGTFMTRSGVVQSVHAFGEDRELALLFTIFMIAILTFSFGLVIYRLPMLRARHSLDSWMSREAAFLANNWILLFSAFFVLFATMYPTLSEALRGERLTVGPPFFNKWMRPIGLMLLLLTGIGPLLAWRKSTLSNLVQQFLWPDDGRRWSPRSRCTPPACGCGARASASRSAASWSERSSQEFIRGAQVRQGATGTDIVTAMIGLVGRSQRRYGGYIVHLGVVLIFLGFAGEGFKKEEQATLKPGPADSGGTFHRAARRAARHQRRTEADDYRARQHLRQRQAGRRDDAGQVVSSPSTRKSRRPKWRSAARVSEDLYVVLSGYDIGKQTGIYAVTVNPLVNWIWFGFAVMALGTALTVLPERAFAFAAAKVPEGAATTTMLLLSLLLWPGGGAGADGRRRRREAPSSAGSRGRSSARAAAAGRSTTAAC